MENNQILKPDVVVRDLNAESTEQNIKISKALQEVIDKRKQRAKQKEETWKRLEEKRDEMEKLRQIYQEFSKLDEEGRKELCEEKQRVFLEKLDSNITTYSNLYQKAIEKLKTLEERFNRETVNLVVIGSIGAGKSKFLQSVSGLDDDCIPSFEGPSCTGITSVIENVSIDESEGGSSGEDWIETTFTFKTAGEVLEDMKNDITKQLKELKLDCQVPEITNYEQGANFINQLNSRNIDVKELIKIYITNKNEWFSYLDASREKRSFEQDGLKAERAADGSWSYILSNNRPKIKEFVAKHDGKEEEKDRTYYYRYVAVKNALIRTKFPRIAAKIRLIDTVGIGDPAGDTEKRMETAINNQADGIIFVLDARNRRTNCLMDKGNEFLMQKFQDIYEGHKNEHASHWMSLIINHIGTGEDYLKTVAKPAFGGENQILGSEGICYENQRAVNVANPSGTLEMVTDFLYQISRYLDRTDEGMEAEAKKLQEEAEECDAEFRSELAKIQIRQNATEDNYIAKLTAECLRGLKENLESYAKDILNEEDKKSSFLKESLNLIQDMIDENNMEKSQLRKIIDDCKIEWGDPDMQRAAAFQKTRNKVREIGARAPYGQEAAAKNFKQSIAAKIKNSFHLCLHKMSSRKIKPFTEESTDFFEKISELLLKDPYDAGDIRDAFHSVDQFRLDMYNGITKALFNHFSTLYIKDDPYAEEAEHDVQTDQSIHPADSQTYYKDLLIKQLYPQSQSDSDTLKSEEDQLLEELKNKLRKFKAAVQNQVNNEAYLVSEKDQKYEELTHFIQILSKEYRSPWEKVFAKLLKEQWISEFEPDKEHQKQLFEVARTLDSLIKKAGKV